MTDHSTSAQQRLTEQIRKARDILSRGGQTIGTGGYAGYCGQLEASLELLCDAAEDAISGPGVAHDRDGWGITL